MYLRNHEDVVLCSRATVVEDDVVLILAIENQPRRLVAHSAGPLTYLKDDIETPLRRCTTKDAFCHGLADVRYGRPTARHSENEEEIPAVDFA